MKQRSKLLSIFLGLALVSIIAVGSVFGAASASAGLTTDEWNPNAAGGTPVFDASTASWQDQTVTFRAVPTVTGSSDPSGFATAAEAEAVTWAFSGTVVSVDIVGPAAVPAENYNAPSGSYASQVTLNVPHGTIAEDVTVVATASGETATFTLHVYSNNGQYLEGDALPPDPSNVDESAYLVSGEPQPGVSINVTFIIEAGDALDEYGEAILDTRFRKELSVDLVSEKSPNSLNTLFLTLDAGGAGTDGLTFYGPNHVPFDDTTKYIAEVDLVSGDVKTAWVAGFYAYDGWVVRVNDELPVKLTYDGLGYEGTNLLEAPLADGDVVHFFYDFPSTLFGENFAANYVRGVYDDISGDVVTVQLQKHTTYMHGNPPAVILDVYNYTNLDGSDVSDIEASIYDADGEWIVDGTLDSNGIATFVDSTLAAGNTYIVKTTPTYCVSEDYDFLDGAFFVLTGAYSEITIPKTQ